MAKHIYNRVKDTPDARDHHYNAARPITVPNTVDLEPHCGPVFDQGQLGSCTANALCGAIMYDENIQSEEPTVLSRLFVYYNERDMEGDIGEDGGAMIRDGVKTLAKFGVCAESIWPYDETTFENKPSLEAYEDGKKHQAIIYKRVDQDEDSIVHALASGFPVVIGIQVYASLESDEVARTGRVPLPNPATDECEGGHAVLAIGYDKIKRTFKIRNSWGDAWGNHGNFEVDFEYLTNPELCDDLWVISRIS